MATPVSPAASSSWAASSAARRSSAVPAARNPSGEEPRPARRSIVAPMRSRSIRSEWAHARAASAVDIAPAYRARKAGRQASASGRRPRSPPRAAAGGSDAAAAVQDEDHQRDDRQDHEDRDQET